MQLHEAIDILKSLNNGYSFSDCEVCENYNELTGICDKEKCDELIAIETVIAELHAMQNLLDEKNDELEYLQKENERYENKIILSDEEYRRVIDAAQKDCISKDKIREKIEELSKGYSKSLRSKSSTWEKSFKIKAQIDILQDLLKDE